IIASIVGEYSTARAERKAYYGQAREALRQCTTALDGDPPSSMDHNNLADLHRQIGDVARDSGEPEDATAHYQLARVAIDEAFAAAALAGQPADAIFYGTRALIWHRLEQSARALVTLLEYGEAEARRADWQDLETYIDNQVLAVQLIFR